MTIGTDFPLCYACHKAATAMHEYHRISEKRTPGMPNMLELLSLLVDLDPNEDLPLLICTRCYVELIHMHQMILETKEMVDTIPEEEKADLMENVDYM